MHAIRVNQPGGPEVLQYEEIARPEPGPGQALIRVKAAGVNFIDVYYRTGQYKSEPPFTPGAEGAGIVEAIGAGVSEVKVGDRVAYAVPQQGSYADFAVIVADKLVPLPEGMDFEPAAAAMLQGMTAQYLTTSTYPIQPGDPVLIHAAAGGAGLLLVQMAKRRGATVIGTVSTEEKAQLAREAGADEVILYTQTDFEVEVKRITGGKGVAVVYDSVGLTTFDKSLNSLRRRGYLVLFGASSGPVPAFDLAQLNAKGSLYVTRPTLFHYIADRPALLERATDVLNQVASGELKLRIGQTYPLSEAAQAHRDLQGRSTTGKLLLLPE